MGSGSCLMAAQGTPNGDYYYCKADGFRRCGVAHPANPTKYADNVFTDVELFILQHEPMLKVEFTGGDTAAPPDPDPFVDAEFDANDETANDAEPESTRFMRNRPAFEDMTVAEIKTFLDSRQVKYVSGDRKADLVQKAITAWDTDAGL